MQSRQRQRTRVVTDQNDSEVRRQDQRSRKVKDRGNRLSPRTPIIRDQTAIEAGRTLSAANSEERAAGKSPVRRCSPAIAI